MTKYTYDAFDQRTAKRVDTDGNGTWDRYEVYTWADGQEVQRWVDTDGAGTGQKLRLANRYLWAESVDQLLSDEQYASGAGMEIDATTASGTAGTTLWALTDHLGSVRDLLDNNGVVRKHNVFDSFGRLIREVDYNSSGTAISSTDAAAVDSIFGYTGRDWDSDIGMQYNRARWYDPQTGRWLSQDPIGFAAGDANLYRYVGNSPTNRTDPSGLQEEHVDPEYVAGRKELQRIYRRYAELYGRNPDKYLWAGLATHAGSQVIQEIYDRLERDKLSALNMAVNGRLANPNSTLVLDMCEKARRQASLLEAMQRIILQMAKDIEADIGKQFEAYDSEGLAGIDRLIQGGMPSDIRGPWKRSILVTMLVVARA